MEDVLRWALLVVGSCVILGVAVHGIWVSRKNNAQKPNKGPAEQEFQPGSDYAESDYSEDDEYVDPTGPKVNIDEPVIDFELDTHSSNKLKDEPTFDELGIGSVRVVSSAAVVETPEPEQMQSSGDEPQVAEDASESSVVDGSNTNGSKIYASVVTQPKPEYVEKYQASVAPVASEVKAVSNASYAVKPKTSTPTNNNGISDDYQAPEPPPFLLKKDQQASEAPTQSSEKNTTSAAEKFTLAEQAKNLVKSRKSMSARKRREPKIAEDQLHIDFDEEPVAKEPEDIQPKQEDQVAAAEEQPQEVLVLNVKAAEGESIPGSALLPMLLTLGFKFGDQDIFHRHVNSNGKGPVLFSLANMFKPGVFDIDNLENFTTQGISLFMILPIEGDPHQVFNMMHNAARKISDEFSAQIYDARRALLTKQSLQQYVEKIREFERQRMLKRG